MEDPGDVGLMEDPRGTLPSWRIRGMSASWRIREGGALASWRVRGTPASWRMQGDVTFVGGRGTPASRKAQVAVPVTRRWRTAGAVLSTVLIHVTFR